MRNYFAIANTNGFMFTEGKLMAYEFISAQLDFENGAVTYTCKLGGQEKTISTQEGFAIYKDEQEFRQSNSIMPTTIKWQHALETAFDTYDIFRDDEGENFMMYRLANNEITYTKAPTANFLYKNGKITYLGEDNYYRTNEEALIYCDLIKVDENGVESTQVCPAKRLALNEEQKKAVEAVRKAIEKAHKLGVELVVDNCYDNLYAYSVNEVERTNYDCKGDVVTKFGVLVNDIMQPVFEKITNLSVDDTGIYVQFKN